MSCLTSVRFPLLRPSRRNVFYLFPFNGVPFSGEDGKKLLRQLGEQFQIDEKVMTYFIAELGMSSIEDFEKMFCNAAEVTSILENVKDLDKKPIQISRVRQAWEGCAKARTVAEGLKRKGEEACDMDTLLNKDDMDKLHNSFWARHKMKWHPTDEPSDYLVSKCSKRMVTTCGL